MLKMYKMDATITWVSRATSWAFHGHSVVFGTIHLNILVLKSLRIYTCGIYRRYTSQHSYVDTEWSWCGRRSSTEIKKKQNTKLVWEINIKWEVCRIKHESEFFLEKNYKLRCEIFDSDWKDTSIGNDSLKWRNKVMCYLHSKIASTHLNWAIGQVHDDGTCSSEPCVQMWNTWHLIACFSHWIATSFYQMLGHVTLEVGQQFHLLFQFSWIHRVCHVLFASLTVDVMHITVNGIEMDLVWG